jgi:hypothetical protein
MRPSVLIRHAPFEVKRGALIHQTLGPDSAPMPMYYTLNGCQTNAGAFKRFRRVEALEYPEQFVDVFHVEADPVVPNENHDLILLLVHTPYFDFGFRPGPREFGRIGHQVDKRELQHGPIPVPSRQSADFPRDVAALRLSPDFAQSFPGNLIQAH